MIVNATLGSVVVLLKGNVCPIRRTITAALRHVTCDAGRRAARLLIVAPLVEECLQNEIDPALEFAVGVFVVFDRMAVLTELFRVFEELTFLTAMKGVANRVRNGAVIC